MRAGAIAFAVLLIARSAPASGSTLGDRINAAHGDQVVFRYETFDDVRGDGEGSINRGDPDAGGQTMYFGNWYSDDHRSRPRVWESGPMNIILTRRSSGRAIRKMKMAVGETWHTLANEGAVDLGLVTPDEAADWLLDQVQSADEDLAKDAVCAATFVKGADTWPRLIAVAKDRSRPEEVRKSCLFWIGQEAGERATATLKEVVDRDDEDSDVRESAVFALTQRPDEESIPVLMRLAKTSPYPEVRRSAFFWLGQKDDPQVIKFLEDVITGG